jgi:hypothetical protein
MMSGYQQALDLWLDCTLWTEGWVVSRANVDIMTQRKMLKLDSLHYIQNTTGRDRQTDRPTYIIIGA